MEDIRASARETARTFNLICSFLLVHRQKAIYWCGNGALILQNGMDLETMEVIQIVLKGNRAKLN